MARRIGFSLLLLVLTSSSALAHALGAKCTVEGEQIVVTAFYDNRKAAEEASVIILNSSKKKVAEGCTDPKGRWSFEAPTIPGKYQAVVDAGQGHRIEVPFEIEPALAYRKQLQAGLAVGGVAGDVAGGRVSIPFLPQKAPVAVPEQLTPEPPIGFSWLKVLIGLGVIAVFSAVLWLALRNSTRAVTG